MSINFIFEDGQGKLAGELSLDTVPTLTNQQVKSFLSGATAFLDLGQLTKVDTAGLAWLFLLVEKSKKYHCELTLKHASSDLMKLARLSNVEMLLPHIDG